MILTKLQRWFLFSQLTTNAISFMAPFKEFVKQNFLPLSVPINHDTLKLLKGGKRKIVLTLVEDKADEKSEKLITLLKAAASANRDIVFSYVGIKQWGGFADTFGVNKKSKLPKMIVWDGDEEYLTELVIVKLKI
ncbi:protein disulfide-isomerase 5-2-like isoform X2 [Pistacia vera]|uniref:protein disulfide-isomerase 5-2-like isoform X2 n=1 Tax=Pistacia vera TaxID=55513 RepID=UPI00126396E4|nr:protein disulfide-isomerase 5-2-like isoform X2 [Pistacia vera]